MKGSVPREQNQNLHLELASKLAPEILFGTSSWNYPGWQGIVYHREYKNEKEFRVESLQEYGAFPWFRSVGIDSSFYSPPSIDTLRHYAELLPKHFTWVSKVWEEITIPRYAKHARYGKKSGMENPHFLDADLFQERVLRPYELAGVTDNTGPFVFEFQRMGKDQTGPSGDFLKRLGLFFEKLPKHFQYAVELRNKELLRKDYFEVLNAHGVTHCFNHWTYMPSLKEQMRAAADAGGLQAPFYVARILTPMGLAYEKAVEQFQPYDRVQQPNPEMRSDIVRLAKRAIEKKVKAYVLVNNRSEGCAPETIAAIGAEIVRS